MADLYQHEGLWIAPSQKLTEGGQFLAAVLLNAAHHVLYEVQVDRCVASGDCTVPGVPFCTLRDLDEVCDGINVGDPGGPARVTRGR